MLVQLDDGQVGILFGTSKGADNGTRFGLEVVEADLDCPLEFVLARGISREPLPAEIGLARTHGRHLASLLLLAVLERQPHPNPGFYVCYIGSYAQRNADIIAD